MSEERRGEERREREKSMRLVNFMTEKRLRVGLRLIRASAALVAD